MATPSPLLRCRRGGLRLDPIRGVDDSPRERSREERTAPRASATMARPSAAELGDDDDGCLVGVAELTDLRERCFCSDECGAHLLRWIAHDVAHRLVALG